MLYPDVTPEEAADVVLPHPEGDATDAAPTSPPATIDHGRLVRLVAIGGSDAGISAALRVRELDPTADVTVVVADAYPNFSICGIPYYVSGEVTHWRNLAHRTIADLEATGMTLRLDTRRHPHRRPTAHRVLLARTANGRGDARLRRARRRHRRGPRPPADRRSRPASARGRGAPAALDGRHLRADAHARTPPSSRAVIVGAGYIGLEMAEALTARGLRVTQIEQLPEVLPTVDPELGALVHAELAAPRRRGASRHARHGRSPRSAGLGGRLRSRRRGPESVALDPRASTSCSSWSACGPTASLAAAAGAELGIRGAIAVDRQMRTGLPDVFAAGDCVVTHHRLLGATYLPLGTTAHKQGRVAGENALGGDPRVRRQPRHAGRQGLRPRRRPHRPARPRSHRRRLRPAHRRLVGRRPQGLLPGRHPIAMRFTGDRRTGRLLGVQLVGHRGAEIAKRIDIFATAIFNGMTVDAVTDLDLSYTPPLGSPWDALQAGAQAWTRAARTAPRVGS